jgi:hypothetical protein
VAEKRRGWQADPTGHHEQRYFSFDGRPTRLVMNGAFTSFDAPPAGLLPAPISFEPMTADPTSAPLADLWPTSTPTPIPIPLMDLPVEIEETTRRSGHGKRLLAEAGIVFGLTALFGAGLAIAALQAHHAAPAAISPTISDAGTTLNISAAGVPGIRSVTVWSLVAPVDSGSVPAPPRDAEYGAAHIELCAGSAGTNGGPDLLYFELLLANGVTVKPNPASTSSPSLATFTDISANSCISGYVTFEIAQGTRPTLIRYEPNVLHDYEWRLPRAH